MFTGIIAFRSPVVRRAMRGKNLVLALKSPAKFRVRAGESISVNGACSTASRILKNAIEFEYMPETLRKTNLKELRVGSRVNLERPLTLSSPLDGHIILGHVDGVGVIADTRKEGTSRTLRVKIPGELLSYIAPKGSIALEGISLTVVKKYRDGFSASLIPYTLAHTNLGEKQKGDSVNVECDVLAKYLREMVRSKNR